MARLFLGLLGGFSARFDGGPPLTLLSRKAQALLAFLALPAGRWHSRETLATMFWGDSSTYDYGGHAVATYWSGGSLIDPMTSARVSGAGTRRWRGCWSTALRRWPTIATRTGPDGSSSPTPRATSSAS